MKVKLCLVTALIVCGWQPMKVKAETQPAMVGNTSLEISTAGKITLGYAGRTVAQGFLTTYRNGGVIPFSRKTPFRIQQVFEENGIEWILASNGKNPVRFKIQSQSVNFQIPKPDSPVDTVCLFLSDESISGNDFNLIFQDGRETQGKMIEDMNFTDPTFAGVRTMSLMKDGRRVLQIIQKGPPGFRFEDLRQDPAVKKRRIIASGEGTVQICFGDEKDASFFPVDIRKQCNMGFQDDVPNDGKGGWMDDGPENDLRMFPVGQKFFSGIPFDVIDPGQNRDTSTLVLQGGPRHGNSFPARMEIPIPGRKASTLHVLHATGWTKEDKERGKAIGAYVIRYADQTEETHEVVYGRDILDWWGTDSAENFRAAWQGTNSQMRIHLGLTSFQLKKPDVPITAVRLEKRGTGGSLFGLAGMTLTDVSLQIIPTEETAGPINFPPLRYSWAGDGGQVAGWVDMKRLNARGVSDHEGYDVKPEECDVFIMGTRYKDRSGTPLPTPEQLRNLVEYVKQGGSLLIAWPLDDRIPGLIDILPVEKKPDRQPMEFVPKKDILRFEPVDNNHPVFSGIDFKNYLAQPYYYSARAKAGSEILAKFSNGEPALIHGRFGKGRILYYAGPFDFGWYIGGITMARTGWNETNYYLRVLYWLKGNDTFASHLGKVPVLQRLREDLSESLARCEITLQNVRALAGYLNKTETAETLKKDFENTLILEDSADRNFAKFDLPAAEMEYTNAVKKSRALSQTLDDAMKSLKSTITGSSAIQTIKPKSGPPLRIGSHSGLSAYCNEASSDCGVRQQAADRLMEQESRLGFNTLALGHSALAYFVKPGAKASPVKDEDLNLWVNDDFLRAAKARNWKMFIEVNSFDDCAWQKCNTEYFHKGVPLLAPVQKSGGKRIYLPNICDEEFLRRRAAVLEKIARSYANRPEVLGFDLDNEPAPSLEYGEGVYGYFRAWLKKKYPTLEGLNDVLQTRYKNFDEVRPPTFEELEKNKLTAPSLRAVWFEWRQFQDEVIVNHFRRDYEAIKRGAPNKIVRDRFSEITVCGRELPAYLQGRHPYYRLTRNLDMTGIHIWALYSVDLMRVQANRAELGFSEYYVLPMDGLYEAREQLRPGLGGPWALPVLESENANFAAAQRNLWIALSRGVRTFSIHSTGSQRGDGIGVYNMFGPSRVNWRKKLYALTFSAAEFARIRGEVDGARAVSQVALLELPESIIQTPGSPIEQDVGYTGGEQKAVFDALHNPLDVQSDPIGPDADLNKYPVLILSQPLFVSGNYLQNLLKYVRQGGQLIVSGPLGLFNEYGFSSGKFLREEMGIESVRRMPISSEIHFRSGLKIKPASGNAQVWRYRPGSQSKIEILAAFSDGAPAIVARQIGKGRIVMTAYAFAQTLNISDQLKELVLPRLQPLCSSDRPIHLFFLERDGKTIIYAGNRNVEPVDSEIRFSHPVLVEDLRAGVRFSALRVPLHFQGGEARVFRIDGPTSK